MITIKEAAKYAGKSESWIRKKILSGELAAEKKAFKYGKRWETTKADIDDLLQQAKMEKEVIEVREIDKPVDKEQLLNEIAEATESRNKKLIDKAVNKINNKIQQQNELIKNLADRLEEKERKKEETLIDKIKRFFIG